MRAPVDVKRIVAMRLRKSQEKAICPQHPASFCRRQYLWRNILLPIARRGGKVCASARHGCSGSCSCPVRAGAQLAPRRRPSPQPSSSSSLGSVRHSPRPNRLQLTNGLRLRKLALRVPGRGIAVALVRFRRSRSTKNRQLVQRLNSCTSLRTSWPRPVTTSIVASPLVCMVSSPSISVELVSARSG